MIRPGRSVPVEEIAAHYDDLDDLYRAVWGEHLHHGLWQNGSEIPERAVQQLVRFVAAAAGVTRGASVCDVGCGYGATARQLATECGAHVTGFTVSRRQFAFATDHNPHDPTLNFRLAGWEQNGLPDGSFDALVSIECLAHVSDKQKFFGEAFRVLRPGRRMVLTAWLAAERPTTLEVRHLLEPICREGRLAGMGSATEYLDMIRAAGFESAAFQPLGVRVRKTWSVCARRILWGLLTRSEYRRWLARVPRAHWGFLFAICRIMIAYRVGAMDYGLFVGTRGLARPAASTPSTGAD